MHPMRKMVNLLGFRAFERGMLIQQVEQSSRPSLLCTDNNEAGSLSARKRSQASIDRLPNSFQSSLKLSTHLSRCQYIVVTTQEPGFPARIRCRDLEYTRRSNRSTARVKHSQCPAQATRRFRSFPCQDRRSHRRQDASFRARVLGFEAGQDTQRMSASCVWRTSTRNVRFARPTWHLTERSG